MKGFQFKYKIDYLNSCSDITRVNICEIAQIPIAEFEDCEWADYNNTHYSVITAPNKNRAIQIFKTRLKNKLNSNINIHHIRQWD